LTMNQLLIPSHSPLARQGLDFVIAPVRRAAQGIGEESKLRTDVRFACLPCVERSFCSWENGYFDGVRPG